MVFCLYFWYSLMCQNYSDICKYNQNTIWNAIIRNGGQVLRNILVTYRLCIIFTIQIRAITKAPHYHYSKISWLAISYLHRFNKKSYKCQKSCNSLIVLACRKYLTMALDPEIKLDLLDIYSMSKGIQHFFLSYINIW